MGLGYCCGNKPRFNYSHCFIFIFLRKLHYCHAIITVISAQQMQVVEPATRRNQRSNCLPVLGRKIFLLFVDVEGPLNALKILYWLVHGTKRQSVLAIKKCSSYYQQNTYLYSVLFPVQPEPVLQTSKWRSVICTMFGAGLLLHGIFIESHFIAI